MPKPAVPIEHKVIRTTALAGLIGIAVAALNGLEANSQLLNWLPATWQAIILTVIPVLATGAVGFHAPHTDRETTGPSDTDWEPFAHDAELDAEAAAYHAGDV